MQTRTKLLSGILLGVILGVIASTSYNVMAYRDRSEAVQIPLEQLQIFSEVYARIKHNYVEEVESKELLDHAIRGMLTGLDPHSSYLNEEEFTELQVGTSGEFGGLGIEVGMENGFVKVIAPIDDTPAERAGVEAGDLVIRLDEKPVKGMTLNDAVKIMRGKPGTDIKLTVVREGTDKPLKITITRDVIKVKSVKSRILEPGFGYVRITSFQSKTTQTLEKAVKELKKDGELKGLILDLRNNPGGVLNAAVGVSDAFLNEGLIVYTEGRVADSAMKYGATSGDLLDGAPIIVLVNQGSASASEIVSGALQDHKRALIVGEKTFGKGSVQTVLPLTEKTAVKLTTARYYTPAGRSIQASGIEPDIIVEPLKLAHKTEKEEGFEGLSEADLAGHLENPNGEEDKDDDKTKKEKEEAATLKAKEKNAALVEDDYQLFEAMNLLKGMTLLENRMKEESKAN